jgi:L-seryl-tRNA(Ser) seleniumtransferase
MAAAAGNFVDLVELQAAVGARLAELTGNEAGYVSSGAWAATTQCVAACMAGSDPVRAAALPTLDGLARTEVVVYPSQRLGYEDAVRLTGATIRAEVCPRTACVLWFAGERFAPGAPPLEEVVATAGVPVLVDAAAQIPPISTLWRYTVELGADAVIVSGGKGLRGPQASGLVLGKRAIVEGCRAHASPHHTVGRGMKVGKEEMLGLLAAVEWSLAQDEPAVIAGYEAMVAGWIEGLRDVVRVERGYPSEAGQPHPRAIVHIGPRRDAVVEALWNGDPRIAVGAPEDGVIALNPQTVQAHEAPVITAALRALLDPTSGTFVG